MENKTNLLKETALLSYQKMDKRPEQTSQQRKYMDGKWASKKMFNIVCHRGNVNRSYIPIRMAKVQNAEITKSWRGCGAPGALIHCWSECEMVQPCQKTVCQFLTKLNLLLLYDPATAHLGVYLNEVKTVSSQKPALMFITALLILTQAWKQLRCCSVRDWLSKLQYIQTMEY